MRGSIAQGIGQARYEHAQYDELGHFGVGHIDMPLTKETIWQAIQEHWAKQEK